MTPKASKPAACRTTLTVLIVATLLSAVPSGECAPPQFGKDKFDLDSPARANPRIDAKVTTYFISPAMIPLWETSLESPDSDLQRRTAELIVEAKRRNTVGLDELKPALRKLLAKSGVSADVHLGVARALAALDDKDSAKRLLEVSNSVGSDAAARLEPKLAEWKFAPAIDVWRARIVDAYEEPRLRILALRGLAVADDKESTEAVLALAVDPRQTASLRIEAARAAAMLKTEGLEEHAKEPTASEPSPLDQLVAATLLSQHDSPETKQILLKLAATSVPIAQRVAIERLDDIAKTELAAIHPHLAESPDPIVRQLSVLNLHDFPTAENSAALAQMLGDKHPDVRNSARRMLHHFAEQDETMRNVVIGEVDKQLNSTSWQALQQSARIFGDINHRACANRCLELLKHDRLEVHTTAAWTLRKLEVEETLAPILEHAEGVAKEVLAVGEQLKPVEYGEHIAQLFQLLGNMQYKPAEPVMRQFIPKHSADVDARVGAFWGLGMMHIDALPAKQSEPEWLPELLRQRLADSFPLDPELDAVRGAAAVALGRMRAEFSLPKLNEIHKNESTLSPQGHGSAWAIERITGEKVKMDPLPVASVRGFFVSPLSD